MFRCVSCNGLFILPDPHGINDDCDGKYLADSEVGERVLAMKKELKELRAFKAKYAAVDACQPCHAMPCQTGLAEHGHIQLDAHMGEMALIRTQARELGADLSDLEGKVKRLAGWWQGYYAIHFSNGCLESPEHLLEHMAQFTTDMLELEGMV